MLKLLSDIEICSPHSTRLDLPPKRYYIFILLLYLDPNEGSVRILKFPDLLSESGFKMPCTQRNIHGKDLVKRGVLSKLCAQDIYSLAKTSPECQAKKLSLSWEFLGGENERVFLF